MTQAFDIELVRKNRNQLNADFAMSEVRFSKQAEYEQHSEITGINSKGEWSSSVPGGGVVNRVKNISTTGLGIGTPVHLNKSTGLPTVHLKPIFTEIPFINPVKEQGAPPEVELDADRVRYLINVSGSSTLQIGGGEDDLVDTILPTAASSFTNALSWWLTGLEANDWQSMYWIEGPGSSTIGTLTRVDANSSLGSNPDPWGATDNSVESIGYGSLIRQVATTAGMRWGIPGVDFNAKGVIVGTEAIGVEDFAGNGPPPPTVTVSAFFSDYNCNTQDVGFSALPYHIGQGQVRDIFSRREVFPNPTVQQFFCTFVLASGRDAVVSMDFQNGLTNVFETPISPPVRVFKIYNGLTDNEINLDMRLPFFLTGGFTEVSPSVGFSTTVNITTTNGSANFDFGGFSFPWWDNLNGSQVAYFDSSEQKLFIGSISSHTSTLAFEVTHRITSITFTPSIEIDYVKPCWAFSSDDAFFSVNSLGGNISSQNATLFANADGSFDIFQPDIAYDGVSTEVQIDHWGISNSGQISFIEQLTQNIIPFNTTQDFDIVAAGYYPD